MGISEIFWILMLIWLVFGVWGNYTPQGQVYWVRGNSLFLFVLLALLGWGVFGFVVHR